MTTSRYSLLIAVGLIGGMIFVGCTHSAVLPSPASLPSAGPNSVPGVGFRQPVIGLPTAGPRGPTNPWKPTSLSRNWKYIVVHHTATASGNVESIHESHLKNKDKYGNAWLGIGYHFVIGNGSGMPDGAIEPTFRWKTQIQGAHAGSANKDYNELGIGVCLVGNFEKTPPTAAQRKSVKLLVQTLKNEYHIPSVSIVGHKDIRASSTECPGKLFPMAEIAADEPPVMFGLNSEGVPFETIASTSGRTFQ